MATTPTVDVQSQQQSQQIESLRFGMLEFTTDQLLRFDEGLLGFPQLRQLLRVSPQGWEPLEFLIPIEAPQLTFPILNPYLVRPNYEFDLGDKQLATLDLNDTDDGLLVFAIATFGTDAAATTLNLMAPILLNPRTRRGRQLILDGSGYRVNEPLLPAGQGSSPPSE